MDNYKDIWQRRWERSWNNGEVPYGQSDEETMQEMQQMVLDDRLSGDGTRNYWMMLLVMEMKKLNFAISKLANDELKGGHDDVFTN